MQVHRMLLDIQGPQQGEKMQGKSIDKEPAEDCLLPSYSVVQSLHSGRSRVCCCGMAWEGTLDAAMVQGRDHGIFFF